MGWGMECRLFFGRSREPLFAANPRSCLWLPGGERLFAESIWTFAPRLDETHHTDAEVDAGFWSRFHRVPASCKPSRARVCETTQERSGAGGEQPFKFRRGRGTRPPALQG